METISTTDLIKNTAEALDPVVTHGRPTLVQRHGKDIAVLISPQDFQLLGQVRLALATAAAVSATPAPDKPESVSQEASSAPKYVHPEATDTSCVLDAHPDLRWQYFAMKDIIAGTPSADYTLVSSKTTPRFGRGTLHRNVYLDNTTKQFIAITAMHHDAPPPTPSQDPAASFTPIDPSEYDPWEVLEWGAVNPTFAWAPPGSHATPKPVRIDHSIPRHPAEL